MGFVGLLYLVILTEAADFKICNTQAVGTRRNRRKKSDLSRKISKDFFLVGLFYIRRVLTPQTLRSPKNMTLHQRVGAVLSPVGTTWHNRTTSLGQTGGLNCWSKVYFFFGGGRGKILGQESNITRLLKQSGIVGKCTCYQL